MVKKNSKSSVCFLDMRGQSVSPLGCTASVKSDSSVLSNFLFLRVSVRLSCSDVGVERICLVIGEVDAGILKIILLLWLSLIR